jgi:head-tail adaptor
MPIASGRRRHVLTLMNPGEMVPDGGGGWTETPAVLGDVYGEILPATVRDLERLMPNVVVASASHLVTIPYLPGVTLVSTVIFHDDGGDRTFSIAGIVDPEERHLELVLACEEAL